MKHPVGGERESHAEAMAYASVKKIANRGDCSVEKALAMRGTAGARAMGAAATRNYRRGSRLVVLRRPETRWLARMVANFVRPKGSPLNK